LVKITAKKRRSASSASSKASQEARPRAARSKAQARPQPNSQNLAREIANLALTKKAFDVVVMDMREVSSATDFFVLASAATDIQAKAVVRAIDDGLRARGIKPYHVEGLENARWVLMDYVDVVAHVMQPRVRDYYGLEHLWSDAPREEIKD